jgi:hypothetical protein
MNTRSNFVEPKTISAPLGISSFQVEGGYEIRFQPIGPLCWGLYKGGEHIRDLNTYECGFVNGALNARLNLA